MSAAYGEPVQVRGVERVAPWFILRCHLTSQSPDLPATVVVKWLRDNPNDGRRDPAQLCTERAALEFLAGLDSTLAPHLLAADTAPTNPHAGVLVLEDVAPREPLRAILLRDGPERAAALLASVVTERWRDADVDLQALDDYTTRAWT